MSQVSGLNEESINALCLEIQDYAERFQVLFNQLDKVMSDSKNAFSDEVANALFRKYATLQSSYVIVKANLFSYIDDFRQIVLSYKNLDALSSSQVKQATIEILEKGDL